MSEIPAVRTATARGQNSLRSRGLPAFPGEMHPRGRAGCSAPCGRKRGARSSKGRVSCITGTHPLPRSGQNVGAEKVLFRGDTADIYLAGIECRVLGWSRHGRPLEFPRLPYEACTIVTFLDRRGNHSVQFNNLPTAPHFLTELQLEPDSKILSLTVVESGLLKASALGPRVPRGHLGFGPQRTVVRRIRGSLLYPPLYPFNRSSLELPVLSLLGYAPVCSLCLSRPGAGARWLPGVHLPESAARDRRE